MGIPSYMATEGEKGDGNKPHLRADKHVSENSDSHTIPHICLSVGGASYSGPHPTFLTVIVNAA